MSDLPFKDENKAISNLLKKHGIDNNPRLGTGYYLYLDLEGNYHGVIGFLKEANEYKFDSLRKLSIVGMQNLTIEDLEHINELTKRGHLKKLEILYLNGGLRMELSKLNMLLPHLIKITDKQIFIDSFKMSEGDLQTVMKYCYRVKNLSIVNCEMTNFGNYFHIPSNKEYRIEKLDLFWSAIEDDSDYLNKLSLPVVLKGIDHSTLGDSLKEVHI